MRLQVILNCKKRHEPISWSHERTLAVACLSQAPVPTAGSRAARHASARGRAGRTAGIAGPPHADEMLSRARHHDDSISLATAYRSLAVLEAAGLVRRLALESGPARYEMRPATDHDHLLDVVTGKLTELDALRERLLADMGLELVSCHSVIRVRRRQ